MTWETELAKAENDTLRTNGDVAGIIAKYSAAAGAVTWTDAEFGAFNTIVGDTWMLNLTNAQRNALFSSHMDVNGNVTLSDSGTRSALQPLLDAEQIAAFTDAYSSQGTLADSLGLPAPAKDRIINALSKLTDSPYGEVHAKHQTWRRIRQKVSSLGNPADSTSLANLTTIESLLGT